MSDDEFDVFDPSNDIPRPATAGPAPQHRENYFIQQRLASGKVLAETAFINEHGQWVKWHHSKDFGAMLVPISQRHINILKGEYNLPR